MQAGGGDLRPARNVQHYITNVPTNEYIETDKSINQMGQLPNEATHP